MAFGSSSTFRGGSGGGRSSYRGGSGGRGGRGRGRHGGGSGGAGPAGGAAQATVLPCKFRPCKSWLQSGSCPNGPRCHYAHVVQLHAALEATAFVDAGAADASGKAPSGFANGGGGKPPQQQRAAVTSVALWETGGAIKIFTGSLDGSWRLWRTADWRAEFESAVGTRVEALLVHGNTHLVCGMEAGTRALPVATVGMCHVWDLHQPDRPPMELQLDYAAGGGTGGSAAACLFPYAHNQAVTALCLEDTSLITGSRDGCIRVWRFDSAGSPPAFVLDKTLFGHAREVTGLVVIGAGAGTGAGSSLLWSGGLDGSIRIWDLASGACRHSITSAPPPSAPAAPGPGHTDAVTALARFQSAAGTFVLSASLDGAIKAWNGATGECVASEPHGEGVVSLAIGRDPGNTEVLLVGLESGNVVCRNLVQTPKAAAFAPLFCLTTKFNQGHTEAVRCITAGPQATFYTGGADGKLMVWQINGDLQLN